MPPRTPHSGHALLALLTTLLIGLAPVACGLMVMAWQVNKQLDDSTDVVLRETRKGIDSLLDALHGASNKVLNLAEFSCEKALPHLHSEVVANPELRSLTLVRENRAYCSTLRGESGLLVDPGEYFNHRLRLEPGNDNTPDSAILYYRLQEYPYGVLAVADGKLLQRVLQGTRQPDSVSLQFGPMLIGASGEVIDANGQAPTPYRSQVSPLYGYTIHVSYPPGHAAGQLWESSLSIAPSLLLVGLMTAMGSYWAMYRRRRTLRHLV
ncbi:CSS-motif domain-containing protein [Pseudomonas japonica]|uniref:CSS motif domain associated with EAL n=1 Tax=Pseudomonas japonica TaxID=256466 RepID=A0A239ERL7_9PSED|nr:CSS-motif domain-containing protein [Pseudomonas japonica]SNS46504.1 CSS motif domain associated with EAL [Pseudomonas japonica]